MKNLSKIICLAIIGLGLCLASSVSAASISFSPSAIGVSKGQTFNVKVSVNPQSVKNYTVKMELTYPSDTLEVVSFTQGGGWMTLSQVGYDKIDNSSGVMIKSAGYPGGLTTETVFGTITFRAKKEGSAKIGLSANSLSLSANSVNLLTGLPVEAFVTISADMEGNFVDLSDGSVPMTEGRGVDARELTSTSTPTTTTDQTASVVLGGGFLSWRLIVEILMAVLVVWFGAYYLKRRDNKDEENSFAKRDDKNSFKNGKK